MLEIDENEVFIIEYRKNNEWNCIPTMSLLIKNNNKEELYSD